MQKIFCLLIFSFLIATGSIAQKGKTTAHSIQLGTFATPKPENFEALKKWGYLYEIKQPNGLSKVMLGTFSTTTLANARLAEVKKKGFKDAFVVKEEVDESESVWIIQLMADDLKSPIVWNEWTRLSKDLVVNVWDDKVKIAAGPYRSRIEADDNFARIAKIGPKDIFIKQISPKLFHLATPFEMGPVTSAPDKLPEAALNPKTVMDLQKLLALEGYFKEKPDGRFGPQTNAALEAFKAGSDRYQDAFRSAKEAEELKVPEQDAKPGTLQYQIGLIATNPVEAEAALTGNKHPMAQAYLAYIYLTDLVATPDKTNTVDKLMAAATKAAFKEYKGNTRYDYSQRYSYTGVQQLLDHLRDMQMATYDEVAVPCFLFDRHPAEMQRAFAPHWGNEKDQYRVEPGCKTGAQFEELQVLQQLAKNFEADDKTQKSEAAKAARTKDAAVVRGLLAVPQAISAADAQANADWQLRLLTSLETWASGGAIQRKMVNAYSIAHYESLIKLQFHFSKNGFTPEQSEAIAQKVVRYSVQQSFSSFIKK